MDTCIAFKGFHAYVDTMNTLHENHKGIDSVLHTNVKCIYEIQKYNSESVNIYIAHFEGGKHVIIEKDIKLMEYWPDLYFWILDTPLVKQFCFYEDCFQAIIDLEGALHIFDGDQFDVTENNIDCDEDVKYSEFVDKSNMYSHVKYDKLKDIVYLWCSSGKLVVGKWIIDYGYVNFVLDQPNIKMPEEVGKRYI